MFTVDYCSFIRRGKVEYKRWEGIITTSREFELLFFFFVLYQTKKNPPKKTREFDCRLTGINETNITARSGFHRRLSTTNKSGHKTPVWPQLPFPVEGKTMASIISR